RPAASSLPIVNQRHAEVQSRAQRGRGGDPSPGTSALPLVTRPGTRHHIGTPAGAAAPTGGAPARPPRKRHALFNLPSLLRRSPPSSGRPLSCGRTKPRPALLSVERLEARQVPSTTVDNPPRVDFAVANCWGTGLQAMVTILNDQKTGINNWQVEFDYPSPI